MIRVGPSRRPERTGGSRAGRASTEAARAYASDGDSTAFLVAEATPSPYAHST